MEAVKWIRFACWCSSSRCCSLTDRNSRPRTSLCDRDTGLFARSDRIGSGILLPSEEVGGGAPHTTDHTEARIISCEHYSTVSPRFGFAFAANPFCPSPPASLAPEPSVNGSRQSGSPSPAQSSCHPLALPSMGSSRPASYRIQMAICPFAHAHCCQTSECRASESQDRHAPSTWRSDQRCNLGPDRCLSRCDVGCAIP